MAQHDGFLKYERALPADRPPLERIGDWQEFHMLWDEESHRRQAARCMDCGIPFCHSGILIKGAASGCPIHNLIPEWNDLLYRGLWKQAIDRLHKTNNFPEFTGRVCPAPCEGSCTVGINQPQVTIKLNECTIVDHAWEQGWIKPNPPRHRSGKTVAIVGSGPSGLACADQLNRAGHQVTVYEREDRIGGLLMYGIPNMKLAKDIVKRRTDLMAAEGVKFITSTEVGRDLPADRLREDFDAVVLCAGAAKPRDLNVPGRQLNGVHFAMDFLKSSTKALLDQTSPLISAAGKDVIVIGGGDTGTDCVGSSIRQKCASITQIEIMPQPPADRRTDNPWPQWPAVLKTDYGQQEAIALYSTDPRVWQTTVKGFEGDLNGQVKAVYTVEVSWQRDSEGRMMPVEKAGSERVLPAQLVLLAMGFLGPEDRLPQNLELSRDARSNVAADDENYSTSTEGVFCAGDMRRGQSLVVWAINEGRRAARACDRYLSGSSLLPG